MKTILSSLIILVSLTIIVSCKKEKANADFSFDVSNATEGRVEFRNNSTGATSYEWNFGDGSATNFSSSSTLSHTYSKNGTYTVTLKAKTSARDKGNSKSQQVTVFNIKSEYMLWTADPNIGGQIAVAIDGVYVGTITSYYASGTPDCGANGCVTARLSEGNHNVYAEATDGSKWTFTINIISGICNRTKLTQ